MAILRNSRATTLGVIVAVITSLLVIVPTRADAAVGAEPFTVVIIPDTQHLIDNPANTHHLDNEVSWVLQNRNSLDIAFVTLMGDLVESTDSVVQWARFSDAMAPFDQANMPWGSAIGNHDMYPGGYGKQLDEFLPVSRFTGRSWFGGYLGSSPADPVDWGYRNTYQVVDANGTDLLIIHLEWDPRPAAVAWAQRVIDAHPGYQTILSSHIGMLNGERWDGPWEGRRAAVDGQGAEQVFQQLVVPNCQVIMVLSGHSPKSSDRLDPNSCGDNVVQLQTNFSEDPEGGAGYLRTVTFDPAAGTIAAKAYSPSLDSYRTDLNLQRTYVWPGIGSPEPPDTTNPTVSINQPIDGATVDAGPVQLRGTANDNREVASAGVALRNRTTKDYLQPDGTWDPAWTLLDSTYNPVTQVWKLTVPNLGPGDYRTYARSFDASGNASGQPTAIFSVVGSSVDNPPITTISSPARGDEVSLPFTVFGGATDDHGIDDVWVAVRDRITLDWLQTDGTWGPYQRLPATYDAPTRIWGWSAPASLPPGSYMVTSLAVDNAGQLEPSPRASTSFEVKPGGVDSRPTATITRPLPNSITTNAVKISGPANDDQSIARVWVAVRDRVTNKWLRPDGTWGAWQRLPTTWDVVQGRFTTTLNLPPGFYQANAIAEDNAGQTTPSPQIAVPFIIG